MVSANSIYASIPSAGLWKISKMKMKIHPLWRQLTKPQISLIHGARDDNTYLLQRIDINFRVAGGGRNFMAGVNNLRSAGLRTCSNNSRSGLVPFIIKVFWYVEHGKYNLRFNNWIRVTSSSSGACGVWPTGLPFAFLHHVDIPRPFSFAVLVEGVFLEEYLMDSRRCEKQMDIIFRPAWMIILTVNLVNAAYFRTWPESGKIEYSYLEGSHGLFITSAGGG